MSMFSRFVAITAMAAVAAIAAEQLPAPSEQVSVFTDMNNTNLPKWQNGHLLMWGLPPLAVLSLFDRGGQLRRKTTITIPAAGELTLFNAAVSPGGSSVVSGMALNWEGTTAAFIAWISPSGEIDRVVRTTPFAPYRLCYADDETLWAFGRLLSDPPGSREELPHGVLRQYSRDGRLLRTALSRDSFPSHARPHPATGGFLTVSKDVIGVYSVTEKQWVEVSARTGEVAGRWPGITGPDQTRITGVAKTASGGVYAAAEHGPGPKRRSEFYRLDRAHSIWTPVDASLVTGPDPFEWRTILGADGDSLVVTKGIVTKGQLDLLWVPTR